MKTTRVTVTLDNDMNLFCIPEPLSPLHKRGVLKHKNTCVQWAYKVSAISKFIL